MSERTMSRVLGVGLALAITEGGVPASAAEPAEQERSRIEEILVTGEREGQPVVNPRTYISAIDAEGINVSTVEDFIAYEPSLIVRRRFVGDPNGTLGIRGSNQFQTTRSMVFADGLPLHYLLQSRFSGAPRWSLVSPDEVLGVEVLYGPFSAEYSGNSMGGVVNIETALPEKRTFHVEGTAFRQDFDTLGTDEDYLGGRYQVSYGDRFGNLSVYLSHNHLENDSQPMTFRFASAEDGTPTGGDDLVGGETGSDAAGSSVFYYGDTGTEEVTTDLTKLKLGYTMGEWVARATFAYEDRERDVKDPNTYLTDPLTGAAFFGSDTPVVVNGQAFDIDASRFALSNQDRRSRLIGLGLDGPLGESGFVLELDYSLFSILEDESESNHVLGGAERTSDFDDTGWVTFDAKLRSEALSLAGQQFDLVVGYHYDRYEIKLRDFRGADRTPDVGGSSGGTTDTQAVFAQLGWQINDRWDADAGVRYENWHSRDGFVGTDTFDDRSKSGVSPKLSVGYAPNDVWQLRYSIARAYRFPIAEELFLNESRANSVSLADPTLEPERGLHHNLMIQRDLENGYIRVNLYRENIEDVIFNQVAFLPERVSTFLPVDEERVNGLELIGNFRGLLSGRLDVRANLNLTDAEIKENRVNPDIEGNRFPRMPKTRANLLLTYHWTDRLDATIGLRYASDSFGSLDNSDREDRVFGAQDEYLFTNLKLSYDLGENTSIGFGVDNLLDEEAYVFHPWPSRTLYLEFSTSVYE